MISASGGAPARGSSRHLHGPVTGTSVMVVTGDHVKASLPLLAEAPDLDVGLHLVLTRRAASAAGGAKILRIVWGRWFYHQRPALDQGDDQETGPKCRGGGDRRPGGVVWQARGASAGLRGRASPRASTADRPRGAAGGHGARSSAGDHPGHHRACGHDPARSGRAHQAPRAHLLGKRAGKVFAGRGVWANDFYFGMLDSASLGRDLRRRHFLRRLPDFGVVEWVVHPGLPDETLRGRDSYCEQRFAELRSLIDPANVHQWQRLRPLLARKSALAAGRPASS